MRNPLTIGGIVLCGGMSQRMGRDKASLPFGDEVLLVRVVRQLAACVGPVVVVAGREQIVPELPGDVAIVRDLVADRGPWQAISAGLHAFEGQVDVVYITSCDSPFLAPGWIGRLIEKLGDALCAVPFIDDHWQPLAGVYRLSVLPHIDRLLADGARPLSLFNRVATRAVLAEEVRDIDPDLRTLCNLNTPEDYQRALESRVG